MARGGVESGSRERAREKRKRARCRYINVEKRGEGGGCNKPQRRGAFLQEATRTQTAPANWSSRQVRWGKASATSCLPMSLVWLPVRC